jgi:hypothetical protein
VHNIEELPRDTVVLFLNSSVKFARVDVGWPKGVVVSRFSLCNRPCILLAFAHVDAQARSFLCVGKSEPACDDSWVVWWNMERRSHFKLYGKVTRVKCVVVGTRYHFSVVFIMNFLDR